MRRWTRMVMLILAGLTVDAAWAQSGSALLLKPWAEGQAVELGTSTLIQGTSHTADGTDRSFGLTWYEAAGRWRLDAAEPRRAAVGFDLTQIDLDTDHGGLPQRLVDQSISIGFGVASFEGWELGMTLGVGYAGEAPYNDGDAIYAKANAIVSYQLDADASLQLLLNYDGHRTVLPDVPLPGVMYHKRVNERWRYSLGLPYSGLTWTPDEKLRVRVGWTLLYNVTLDVDYELVEELALIAGLHSRNRAFVLSDLPREDRLFLRQRRVEGGLRWTPCENASLVAVGGWAFNQEFTRGFNIFNADRDIDIADAPYVRIGLDLRF